MTAASPSRPTVRFSPTARWSAAGLVLIMLIAVAVAVWAASSEPSRNTLRYELATIAMQVVAVAVLGGLATLATAMFRDSLKRDAEQRDAAAARRRQQDDLLRGLLDETLTAYNRVKRIRRLLSAFTAEGSGRITLDVYDEQMRALMDQQLEFERFKRHSPFIDDERLRLTALPSSSVLTEHYRKIEKYLNWAIDEYQSKRHLVAESDDGLPVCELRDLTGFIRRGFIPGAADRIDEIIAALQCAMLRPLEDG
jgi:hypothetical protein